MSTSRSSSRMRGDMPPIRVTSMSDHKSCSCYYPKDDLYDTPWGIYTFTVLIIMCMMNFITWATIEISSSLLLNITNLYIWISSSSFWTILNAISLIIGGTFTTGSIIALLLYKIMSHYDI
jgi:hypothetical protein